MINLVIGSLPDIRIHEDVPGELEDLEARHEGHGGHQTVHLWFDPTTPFYLCNDSCYLRY